jgi:hypothetical protein
MVGFIPPAEIAEKFAIIIISDLAAHAATRLCGVPNQPFTRLS